MQACGRGHCLAFEKKKVVCSDEEIWRSCLEYNTLDSWYDKTIMEVIAQWIFLTRSSVKSGFSSVYYYLLLVFV